MPSWVKGTPRTEEELVEPDAVGVVLVVKLGCSVSLTKASIEASPPSPPVNMLPFPFQASMLLSRLLTSSARVLIECGVQAVKTNIPFLFNVLNHPEFDTGIVTMAFINKNPQLKRVSKISWDMW